MNCCKIVCYQKTPTNQCFTSPFWKLSFDGASIKCRFDGMLSRHRHHWAKSQNGIKIEPSFFQFFFSLSPRLHHTNWNLIWSVAVFVTSFSLSEAQDWFWRSWTRRRRPEVECEWFYALIEPLVNALTYEALLKRQLSKLIKDECTMPAVVAQWSKHCNNTFKFSLVLSIFLQL